MAHDLSTASGRVEMMYVGEAPWHGLGTKLDGPATSAEAMEAAGLGFEVGMDPLFTADGREAKQARAVRRNDTGDVLAVVGAQWTPIQNREAFDFLDGMVADGSLRYHTAGALGRGERVWMLAKLPGEVRVNWTDDVTEKYLLLSNVHGYGSLRAFFTPIRVVCQNTLAAASTKAAVKSGVSIRHTGEIAGKLDEARHVLGLAESYYEKFQEQVNALASVRLTRREALTYFEAVVPPPEGEDRDGDKDSQKRKNVTKTHDALLNLFDSGRGANLPGVRHTLWTAYNAVTEFVDHTVPKATKVKSLEQARANRLASAWFGQGANLKGRAFDAAMARVN